MYKKLHILFGESIKGEILGVSGIDNFRQLIDMNYAELKEINYPEVDMHYLPYEDNTFDYVISDQVIEHLYDPQKAVDESYRVLKKNGIAIHTTCFINYIHPCPRDYWRFSNDGLRYLCRNFSDILCCEGWGNRIAIMLCLISDRFRFMRIPETMWSIRHLIANYNEAIYPIVTWIVAKK